jgi:hypothetical protein
MTTVHRNSNASKDKRLSILPKISKFTSNASHELDTVSEGSKTNDEPKGKRFAQLSSAILLHYSTNIFE